MGVYCSFVPRLFPSFLSHTVVCTVCDKKLGRSLGTRLCALYIGYMTNRIHATKWDSNAKLRARCQVIYLLWLGYQVWLIFYYRSIPPSKIRPPPSFRLIPAQGTVLPAKRVHFGFFEKIVYNFKQTSSMFKIS